MQDMDTKPASSQPGLRDSIDIGGQAGLATYVAAKLFGSPSLPPGTPDWLKDSIESQANFAQRLPGTDAMTIGGAGGGPIDMKTDKERRRDADAEAVEYFSVRLEEAERERQQWAEQRHGIAGVEMTGAEWSQLAQRLRSDDELKQRVLEAFRSRGMTSAEAETRYDRVADVAEAMAIPRSQWTEQQAATVSKAEADSSFKEDIQDMKRTADVQAGRSGTALSAKDPVQAASGLSTASPPVTILNGPVF